MHQPRLSACDQTHRAWMDDTRSGYGALVAASTPLLLVGEDAGVAERPRSLLHDLALTPPRASECDDAFVARRHHEFW